MIFPKTAWIFIFVPWNTPGIPSSLIIINPDPNPAWKIWCTLRNYFFIGDISLFIFTQQSVKYSCLFGCNKIKICASREEQTDKWVEMTTHYQENEDTN